MRNHALLPGIILILIGVYLFLHQFNPAFTAHLFSWQIITMIIGILFIFSAITKRKNAGSMIPGVILLGVGIHFLGLEMVREWPTHWSVYTLIVSLAFFAHYVVARDRGSLVPAFILFAVTLFSSVLYPYIEQKPWVLYLGEQWWPIILILIGILMLFRRR